MDAKAAAPLRNTPGLIKKIETSRDDIVKRFDALVSLASVTKTDRNTSANLQFQMQVETSHLIKAAEDLQTLIRHLQEMWLFGPLNTVGESQVQQQTDESAKIMGELLRQLSSKQHDRNSANGEAMNEES
ncbi:hypothetical protein Q7P35_010739 [Cladosporium inversicolor]